MVKSSEFHRQITKRGKKRGWKWLKGEGEGSHRIYEDKMVLDTQFLTTVRKKWVKA